MEAMTKKRWLKIIGIGVLLLLIVILIVVSKTKKKTPATAEQPTTLITVTPASILGSPWIPKAGDQVDETKIPPNTILIKDFSFHPQTLRVTAGAKVQIVNADTTEHSISSNTTLFDTGLLGPSETATLSFAKEGTYPYHCRRHSAMQASIIVSP